MAEMRSEGTSYRDECRPRSTRFPSKRWQSPRGCRSTVPPPSDRSSLVLSLLVMNSRFLSAQFFICDVK
ncbi:hypothetical protein Taro_048661 [Colocasia esculenta]|uniref:Uncharacterized protein n=1 Tax=Colocasia esculenta TaxID=4460 RepID=A0A843X8S0_COLES|nr:hypothetical protein [Colocasia esculenta]